MKRSKIFRLALGWFLLGCSPSGREALNPPDYPTFGADLKRLEESFQPNGFAADIGKSIIGKIANVSDRRTQIRCLEQFTKTLFSLRLTGREYMQLPRSVDSLQSVCEACCNAVWRSKLGYCMAVQIQVDFLKWLKQEIDRPKVRYASGRKGVGPVVSWIAVSMEDYQVFLETQYELRLIEIERAFAQGWLSSVPKEEVAEARKLVEEFLGRPIRTKEELRRDRGKPFEVKDKVRKRFKLPGANASNGVLAQ